MSSLDITRFSPVRFNARPAKVVKRMGWEIVLAYDGEGEGPWLVDLSHRPKWDLQSENLDSIRPFGETIPPIPGQCSAVGGWLVSRMNRTQAALWHLGAEQGGAPADSFATEITDGLCLLAVAGRDSFAVMEKLTPLDLAAPAKDAPYLVQGPLLHVPAQVVVLRRSDPVVILMAFARGYGQAMAETVLDAGRELCLRPGGEERVRSEE